MSDKSIAGENTRSFRDRIINISENILFALVFIMVIIVFANVVARYIFDSAITESEELARYCFIWSVFIGAVLALEKNQHIGIDFVVKMIPHGIQKGVLVLSHICIVILSGLCSYYGFVLCMSSMGWPSPALRIPHGVVGLIVPISFIAVLVIEIDNIVKLIRGKT